MTRKTHDFPVPPPHIRVVWQRGSMGGTQADEFVSVFHQAFPLEVEQIAGIVNEIVTEARGLDAKRVQDGACERLRLHAWRLWMAAQQAEEQVVAYYGNTRAPGGGRCLPGDGGNKP